jgi:hypothetical protein
MLFAVVLALMLGTMPTLGQNGEQQVYTRVNLVSEEGQEGGNE